MLYVVPSVEYLIVAPLLVTVIECSLSSYITFTGIATTLNNPFLVVATYTTLASLNCEVSALVIVNVVVPSLVPGVTVNSVPDNFAVATSVSVPSSILIVPPLKFSRISTLFEFGYVYISALLDSVNFPGNFFNSISVISDSLSFKALSIAFVFT